MNTTQAVSLPSRPASGSQPRPVGWEGDGLSEAVARDGFASLPASRALPMFRVPDRSGWGAFADSWNRLELDGHMADGGRYRRRRHATFSIVAPQASVIREPHQPHYQDLAYNPLNGGIARNFAPVEPVVAQGSVFPGLLAAFSDVVASLDATLEPWHVEVHQFRTEVCAGAEAPPTPEGIHRDGVDYAFMLLVGRRNIERGQTGIYSMQGRKLAEFTLEQPGDLAVVDDRRVLHGVTPIRTLAADAPGRRDVLVVTFRRKAA